VAPTPLARRMRSRVSGPTGDHDHVGPRQIPARGVAETASRRSRLRSPPSQRKIVRERPAGRSPTGSGCGRYSAPCTHADVSEFHLCILMQRPVSPFATARQQEVSDSALTLDFWVGQIDAESVRCPGRLNGVSGGVQIILSALGRRAGSCRPARARPRLAARAAGQRRVGTADHHQRRPGVQHPPGCPTEWASRAHRSRECTRSARCPGAAR